MFLRRGHFLKVSKGCFSTVSHANVTATTQTAMDENRTALNQVTVYSALLLVRPNVILGPLNLFESAYGQFEQMLRVTRSRGQFQLDSADVKKGPIDGDPFASVNDTTSTPTSSASLHPKKSSKSNETAKSVIDLENLSLNPVEIKGDEFDRMHSSDSLPLQDITRSLDKRLYLVVQEAKDVKEGKKWSLPISKVILGRESLEKAAENILGRDIFCMKESSENEDETSFSTFSLGHEPISVSKKEGLSMFYMQREILGGSFSLKPDALYGTHGWMSAQELKEHLLEDQFKAIEPFVRET